MSLGGSPIFETASLRARLFVRPSWLGAGGMRELLIVGFPLILSSLSASINIFVDRIFLAHFDILQHKAGVESVQMSASLSGGTSWWWAQQLFLGIIGYSSTFISQYFGAKRFDRMPAIVWQTVWLSVAGGCVSLLTLPMWKPLFVLFGHQPELAALEAKYCQILSLGSVFLFLNTGLGGFYTGRGKTRLVMIVNFVVAGANILLNWWFVFTPPAWLPFIKPGLVGSACGTAMSMGIGTLLLAIAVFSPHNVREFGLLHGVRVDWPLIRRMVHFGFPQGMQSFLDLLAFQMVFLVMARLDLVALQATTIAFNLNLLAFIPMVGLSQAITVLTGQFIGAGRPELAEKTTASGITICLSFMAAVCFFYVATPDMLIGWFSEVKDTTAASVRVHDLAKYYLILVSIYSVADAFALVYGAPIRGAGDMRYFVVMSGVNGVFVMIIPCLLAGVYHWPVNWLWLFITGFIFIFGAGNLIRYWTGKWKRMKVIEAEVVSQLAEEE